MGTRGGVKKTPVIPWCAALWTTTACWAVSKDSTVSRACPRIAAFRGSVIFDPEGSRRLAPGRIARGNGESNESALARAAEGVD